SCRRINGVAFADTQSSSHVSISHCHQQLHPVSHGYSRMHEGWIRTARRFPIFIRTSSVKRFITAKASTMCKPSTKYLLDGFLSSGCSVTTSLREHTLAWVWRRMSNSLNSFRTTTRATANGSTVGFAAIGKSRLGYFRLYLVRQDRNASRI